MNYNKWVVLNMDRLSKNYKSRYTFINKTNFEDYCSYIYNGIFKNCWLPVEHTKNLINKEKQK